MTVITFDLDYWASPIIDLYISPSLERTAALARSGQPSGRWPVRALVDSGASRTFIQRSVIGGLGLEAAGETDVYTASSGAVPITSATYKVRLFLQRVAGDLIASDLEVVEAEDLSGLHVDVLLGRDVLGRCLLVYNGAEKKLTIAFDPPSDE